MPITVTTWNLQNFADQILGDKLDFVAGVLQALGSHVIPLQSILVLGALQISGTHDGAIDIFTAHLKSKQLTFGGNFQTSNETLRAHTRSLRLSGVLPRREAFETGRNHVIPSGAAHDSDQKTSAHYCCNAFGRLRGLPEPADQGASGGARGTDVPAARRR
jgi:hypothetical protein